MGTSTHRGTGISNDTESTYPDHLPMTTTRYDMEVKHCDEGWGGCSFSLEVFLWRFVPCGSPIEFTPI